ncbi:MAG TPA: sugar ABC transporter permease [Candidatus Blautia ornithocaccae]|uniref:Sugar ABC transporter permease n=1 Tax=Candidatus Blautia merdavium TaxID=2838494 RepID=A0A9D2PQ04_9FIRM|nr:sugar ABC transporter permease [Candidatus Blautia merdavium]HJD36204.1 sugar ABC transporter permease [Candidatus Blautia ornithocaccae]
MRAKLKTKFSIGNYFFVLPAVLLNFVFFLFPFFQSLVMSFYDWPVLGEKTFVFLENYRALLEDTQFWHSLFFTLKYALFVTPCLFILAFILALLINGAFAGVKLFRSLYFAPVVISMTCCSMVWLWIYNDLYGVLNYILQSLRIIDEPILWMNSADTSLPAVIFMVTWKMAGFSMLIILAAFQSVDEEIYEAASVDGANKISQFFRITLPIIKPHAALALVLSVIGSVLAFEQFLIMTKGGPAQDTTTIVHYIYNTSFKYFKMGYGSAMTMVLLVVLGVLSYFENRVLKDPTK